MSIRSKHMGDFRAFISYDELTGKEYADHLQKALDRNSIKAFVASVDDRCVESIPQDIYDHLYNLELFILILTANTIRSGYAAEEIARALDLRKKKNLRIIGCKHEKLTDEYVPQSLMDLNWITFDSKGDLANQVIFRCRPDDDININTHISYEAESAGIRHIFINRRSDSEFSKILRDELIHSKDILMMANSARDFFAGNPNRMRFGNPSETKYYDLIQDMLNKNLRMKLILLNPLSEAARDRYLVEYGPSEDIDKSYLGSTLFNDINKVSKWFCENREIWENKIELRFSSLTPTVFMIRTDNYTFIEQYHMGDLMGAEIEVNTEDTSAVCLGGYVPIFMVENSSSFARLMRYHFKSIWKKAEKCERVFEEIDVFIQNPDQYRINQLIRHFNSKSQNYIQKL